MASTAESIASQENGWVSSSGRVTASASTPATSRRAAIAWVSGEAARKLRVSVTRPA